VTGPGLASLLFFLADVVILIGAVLWLRGRRDATTSIRHR
jgi:hypothetical protein